MLETLERRQNQVEGYVARMLEGKGKNEKKADSVTNEGGKNSSCDFMKTLYIWNRDIRNISRKMDANERHSW